MTADHPLGAGTNVFTRGHDMEPLALATAETRDLEQGTAEMGVPAATIDMIRHRRAPADVTEREAALIHLAREAVGANASDVRDGTGAFWRRRIASLQSVDRQLRAGAVHNFSPDHRAGPYR